MASRQARAVLLVAAVAVLSLTQVGGCSVSIGTTDEETSDGPAVERVISDQLASASGVEPESVSCPSELVHEEGRRYECTVVHPTDGEQVVDVTMHAPTGFDWVVRGTAGGGPTT